VKSMKKKPDKPIVFLLLIYKGFMPEVYQAEHNRDRKYKRNTGYWITWQCSNCGFNTTEMSHKERIGQNFKLTCDACGTEYDAWILKKK